MFTDTNIDFDESMLFFREMRRMRQMLPYEEQLAVLHRGKTAVLGVIGDYGYPYTVPVNFVFYNDRIYIHCAKEGHKIDAIKANDKVSLCIVDRDDILQEKYTTLFKSVIVFGRARLLEDEDDIRETVTALAEKYCPDAADGIPAEVEREMPALAMIEITIEHLSGKQCIEFVRGDAV